MTKAQGCSLKADGGHRAASKIAFNRASETGWPEKARGLQRRRISSWTGASAGAGLARAPFSKVSGVVMSEGILFVWRRDSRDEERRLS